MLSSILPAEAAAGVTAILGERFRIVDDLTHRWAVSTRSVLVETATSKAGFVVQWSVSARATDRRAMDRRLRLGRQVARLAPRLPIPEVLGGDSHGPTPYVVSRFVSGISGREMLGDDAGAALVGAAIGRAARDIAGVPTAGLRLSRTWSDPDRLGAAAGRWLKVAGSFVDPTVARPVHGLIERLPEVFAGVPSVLAHGDLTPVNVLIRDGAVVALLDLERARLAHMLFDAAWSSWIIRHHHPTRWPEASRAFFPAAGIEQNAGTLAQLNLLAVLQCLEVLAATPPGRPGARLEWANRVVAVLDWMDRPEDEDPLHQA